MHSFSNLNFYDQGIVDGWFCQVADRVRAAAWPDDVKSDVLGALMMPKTPVPHDHGDLIARLVAAGFNDKASHDAMTAMLLCDGHLTMDCIRGPLRVIPPWSREFFWSW